MKSSKLKTCHSHLGELYAALQHGDIKMVQTLEHELTPTEECVAGIYVSILGFKRIVWIFLFKAKNFNFFSLNVFEFVSVIFLTVLIFIYFDDKLLD